MKNIYSIIIVILFFSCDSENVPTCIKSSGEIISEEVEVAAFDEIIVYERVKLFVEEGEDYKVVVETGENLIDGISVEVKGNRLSLRNENSCNLFRNYEVTKIYVTTPTLNWLQNSSGSAVESIGTLTYPEIWLRSFNQERDPDIHTNGDFILDLDVEDLRITNDNISNYYLKGKVNRLDLYFASGDGRLEAGKLIAQSIDIMHRGTNKLIVNPQHMIKGDIYGFGDVIAKNKPSTVRVNEHYTGRLIFE